MNFKKFSTITSLLCFVITSINYDKKTSLIHTDLLKNRLTSESPQKDLDKLDSIIAEHKEYKELDQLVSDVKLILKAQINQKNKSFEAAKKLWTEALVESKGPYAEQAFKGWLDNFLSDPDIPNDTNILAQLVLYHTENGKISEYMSKKNLTNIASIENYLKSRYPNLKSKSDPPLAEQNENNESQSNLTQPDPLYLERSKQLCNLESDMHSHLDQWQASLNEIHKNYLQGLILKCQGKELAAIDFFRQSANLGLISKKHEDHPIALVSYEHLVKLLRLNDGRAEAASFYKALMKSWALPGVTAQSMGLNSYQFNLRKIDDALWAARYRALIADYDHARQYVQIAIDLISETPNQVAILTEPLSKELAEYQAEAYSILASRIAVENHEYDLASNILNKALFIPYLSKDWHNRFTWQLGLYYMLGGKLHLATSALETLLEDSQGSSRAKLLFWLAYTYSQRGHHEKSQIYLKDLGQNHTLDFYNVVAPNISGISKEPLWQRLFPNPQLLSIKLNQQSNYDTQKLRMNEDLSSILAKTEFLLYAGLKNWARRSGSYLYYNSLSKIKIDEPSDDFIYLSRLLYSVGDYYRAIALTSELNANTENFWQKWPEQIHIFFPRAYTDLYQKEAQKNAVEVSLLYAITRQESSFNSQAISFANAHGLMQIIKPTAKRMTKMSPLDWDQVQDELHDPNINIMLGSLYNKVLKLRYKGNLPAAIAAYNAGEYAVDVWLRRRNHPNPLFWVELIPFGETRDYVQKVWRNYEVYKFIGNQKSFVNLVPDIKHLRHAQLTKNNKFIRQ